MIKEILFAVQFILCQESYSTPQGQVTSKIKAIAAFDDHRLTLKIHNHTQEYRVLHIEQTGDGYIVLFEDSSTRGVLKANSYELYFEFTVPGETPQIIRIKYKILITNISDTDYSDHLERRQ